MRFALMTEPQQGLAYEEILALARTAEEAGFEAFFRSDHYASFPGAADLPTTDAWATLAGLARETSRIGLGSLVSPVTFRAPGQLAKLVATVDEMSGGRVELGLGAGWNEDDHGPLGLPFPPLGERFGMLEEMVAIVHGLWTEPDGWSFPGDHWTVRNARFHPKPVRAGRRHPPIILGGRGGPRLARLAAAYADEFNLTSASPEAARQAFAAIRSACDAVGRDPASITLSAMSGMLVADTEAELRDRTREQLAVMGGSDTDAEAWLAERRRRWIIGTPDHAQAMIDALADAGAQRIMLQDFLPRDIDMVRLAARLWLPVSGPAA
jgi:F420-dependent oxidoreductase-like protein